MKDSYQQFFSIFPKKQFFDFGLENIINADQEKASKEWANLVRRISQKDTELYIRSSGKNGAGNEILASLYKATFGINIKFDPTNNQKPTIVIQELTGHKKNKTIQNYQVSHVFGRTKNVFCFTAPWNIIFIPKLIDPFTGHEAKGEYVTEFQKLLKGKIAKIFHREISEYNFQMLKFKESIDHWINNNVKANLKESMRKDFEEIKEES